MRKIFSLILTLALVLTFGVASAFAADSAGDASATVMKIAGTSGTVKIATEKGKDVTPSDGTKLLTGYTVKTAAASYCYISLDDAKAIKLDQNTKVKIEKSGKKIEITLKSGQLYFDVEKKLSGNESMNIKTSNLTTGIRGTSGTMQLLMPLAITEELRNKVLSDLSALRTRPVTTMQLFSGQTEIKPGIGIGPSAKLSAGEQLTFALTPGIPSTPGTPGLLTPSLPAPEQFIQKSELEIDNFGARAIIENAAIKNGMPVGEALQASTEKIVEQAGAALETLQVADNALQQISDAVSDPQLLDEKIAGEEQQAVQQTEAAAQTIEGAKTDAGSGSAEGAASEQVFENVSVQQSSGIDAGKAVFDGNAVTVEDTPTTRPSTGGGSSSGGQQEEAWLTGYTGTYDCQSHAIATNLSARLADYDIWFFNDADRYNELVTLYSRVESEYAEVSESMAGTSDGAPAFGAYLRNYWSDQLAQFDSNLATSDSQTVENVADSGVYYYFAIEKGDAAGSRYGDVRVLIGRAEISIKWYDLETNEEVAQNAVFPAGTEQIPVEPVIGVYRTPQDFVIFGADDDYRAADTISSGGVNVTFRPVVAGDAPQGRAGEYTVRLASYIQDAAGTNYTGRTQTDNYFLSGQNTQYTYRVATPPVGSVVADQDFFSAANRATWGDYTTYDLAFIAENDGNTSTYTKYARVNGPGTQSEVTPEVDVSEVLAALGSSSNTYNTILWDTGRTAQYLSPSVLSAAQAMAATASNRAIYISGAGIDCGFETSGTISMTSGGGLLVVKIGDGAGLTASDEGTRFKVPNLNIGANTYVTNNGTVTLTNSMTVSGDFVNYRNLTMHENAAGPIYLRGGFLTQESGTIWDKRQILLNSETTEPNPQHPMFNIMGGGNVEIYGGSLKRDLNVATGYTLPADYVKTLVYASFGNNMTMHAMDSGRAFTYTAPDGTQARAYKFYYYTAAGGNNIAGSFINNGVTTLSTATDSNPMGGSTTHKNIWATELNTTFGAASYPNAAYAQITFPIAGSDASFTEYVAPTQPSGLVVTNGVFDESNRADWSDYTKYDVALIAGEVNQHGIREYQFYRHGEFANEPIGFDTVSDWLKDVGATYSSIYWEPTPADAAELYNPLNVAAGNNPVFDGNLEIAATTTNKAVFISGPGIATAGYTTFSAVGSNKLFVRVGDGSAAAAGTSQTAIESANISIGSGVDIINSGRLTSLSSITVTSGAELINEGLVKFKDSGMSNAYLDGDGTFKNAAAGEIAAGLESPTVINGTGALINEGHMVIPCGLWITEGTTLLNRGKIDISETHEDYLDIHGGTFTQEVPTGVNPDNVYVRDYETSAFDSEGNYTGAGNGNHSTFSFRAAGGSGTINLNGGSVQKIITNNVPVNATADHLRLETIAQAIFGSNITCEAVNYTSQNGAGAVEAIKCTETGTYSSAGTINGSVVSGGSVAATSGYFYVTSDAQSTPGAAVFNKISFPAPAGTYEVATNPTGLTIVSGAGTAADGWLTGYRGTYDGEPHPAVSMTALQESDYYIWAFVGDKNNNNADYEQFVTSAEAILSETVMTATADDSLCEAQLSEISETMSGWACPSHWPEDYSGYYCDEGNLSEGLSVQNVADSDTFNYFALPKKSTGSALTGTFSAAITKAALGVAWAVSHPAIAEADGIYNADWPAEQGAVYPYTTEVPVAAYVGTWNDDNFDQLDEAEYTINGIDYSGYEDRCVLTTHSAVSGAGTYYVTITGIKYNYQDEDVTMELDNYYLNPATLSYTYTLEAPNSNPTGTHITIVSGAAANSWLAGYSGTYDGDPHSPVSLSAVQQSDYWIWAFNDDDFNFYPNGDDFTPFVASMQAILEDDSFNATAANLAQVQSSIGGEQLPSVTSRALTYNDWHLISNRETLVQEIGVVDVLSSGDYNYFALPKYPTGSAFTGTFTIDITRAAIGVEWFVVHPDLPNALDPEWDVEQNGIPASSRATMGAIYPYNNDVEVPVIPYLVAGPASSELYSMPNVGWHELNGESFRGYELLTTNSAVNGAGTYSVTVTGIKCYDNQGNVIAEQMYVDNYYIDPATATYTYTLQPEGGGSNTGLVVTDGVFDESNRANWSDSSNYDVRYVAVNDSSYMKYVNGAEMGTSVGIDEVLAAMSSTTYSSIYWDTGDSRRTVPDTYANNVEISAETANKAVLITGAGINFGTVMVTLSAVDGKKVYVRTESDSQDYSFGATTVTVDENAEFINSGSIKTQTLNVQHEGAMLTNIGAIEAKYVNVANAGCLSNDAMFTLSEYGTGSVGAFNIQSGGATVTNSGILNIGGTPVTITDGAILANMSSSNIISEGATVTIGAGSLLSNEGNINIEGGTNVGIAVAAGGEMTQNGSGCIWDSREVSCSFESGVIVGITADNGGLINIEEGAEVKLYGGTLKRSIAVGTNFNEIEDDGDLIEAIVKVMFRAGEIDPIEIVDGELVDSELIAKTFTYSPSGSAAPEVLPRAVLCRMDEGSGNIHGSVQVDDNPVLNDDLDLDIFSDDTNLDNTFWATYNSADFVMTDSDCYVYLSFPVPAGTFAD